MLNEIEEFEAYTGKDIFVCKEAYGICKFKMSV